MWVIPLTLALVGFYAAPSAATPLIVSYPHRDDCICVPRSRCRSESNPNGTIDSPFDRSNFSPEFSEESENLFDNTENFVQQYRNEQLCGNLHVCCKPPYVFRHGKRAASRAAGTNGCGYQHPEIVISRIAGGLSNKAAFGEFPWMVAVYREEPVGPNKEIRKIYQCGGSLIHKQAVLTAAHCVEGKRDDEWRIRAGEWDTETKDERLPHQDRRVQDIIAHEQHIPGVLFYDFAILILSEPVELAENVDIVCLPDQDFVFDGSRCLASGWGKDKCGSVRLLQNIGANGSTADGHEGHYQKILKKVELPVVPHNACEASLRKTRLGKLFILHDSFICAGGEADKDTCKGDGGSPLVCPVKNDPERYLQAGIAAWGVGCGEEGIPGVYANVALVRDWIDEKMALYNLDNTVYAY